MADEGEDVRAFVGGKNLAEGRHAFAVNACRDRCEQNLVALPESGSVAHEIGRLDLPAQLVVLSACQTGLGSEVRGEGLISLTRSFLRAGASKVMVSLWNVNDRATAELMERFYRALIDHSLPPASALRCAQLSMRRQTSWKSPFYWAPFIFQGEWNAVGEPPIEKQAVPSQPPPVPDVDFPPPGSGGMPPCPELR